MSSNGSVFLVAWALMAAAVGLALGLWWGERGRRAAAERTATYGTPEAPRRRRAVSRAPAQEAEDRFFAETAEYKEAAIDQLAEDIMATARAQGISKDKTSARDEAERMLHGVDVFE